jgi:CubicO group peptidase (beta-lactamase class C family)
MCDYKKKYIKYKAKYIELQNFEINNMIGGSNKNKMKINVIKIKQVKYSDNKLYALNNIDDDKLDEYSEFPIGSITKLFTIISILLLEQDNKLKITDKIGKYIKNKEISNLKILDIINHESGLINIWKDYKYGSSKKKFNSVTEVYEENVHPGIIDDSIKNTRAYSNLGYQLLGVIIENISSLSYSEFVKNNILKPLDMENSGINDCNIILYNKKQQKLTKYEKWERTFFSSAGELKSCVNDLINFSNFNKLLNNNSLENLKKIWCFKETNDEYNFFHNGGISGGKTEIFITWDKNWKIKNIKISLNTISN